MAKHFQNQASNPGFHHTLLEGIKLGFKKEAYSTSSRARTDLAPEPEGPGSMVGWHYINLKPRKAQAGFSIMPYTQKMIFYDVSLANLSLKVK